MQNTTVKTGKGWNWLWAAEKSYGGEESDQRLRAGNKPPGGVVGPFGLPGESVPKDPSNFLRIVSKIKKGKRSSSERADRDGRAFR